MVKGKKISLFAPGRKPGTSTWVTDKYSFMNWVEVTTRSRAMNLSAKLRKKGQKAYVRKAGGTFSKKKSGHTWFNVWMQEKK